MTSTSFNSKPFVFRFYRHSQASNLTSCWQPFCPFPQRPQWKAMSSRTMTFDCTMPQLPGSFFSLDSSVDITRRHFTHLNEASHLCLPKTAKRMPPCHTDIKHRHHCILKRQALKEKRNTIRTNKKRNHVAVFFQCSFGFLLLFSPAPCFFILSIYILHSLCQYFNSGANWLWLMLDRESVQPGCQFFFPLFLLKLSNHYASFPSFTSTSGATVFHVQAIYHYLLPNGQLAAIFLICTRWLHNIKIG